MNPQNDPKTQPVQQKIAVKAPEPEIDLVEIVFRLVENIKYIVPAAILGAILAAIYTFNFVTPMYTAVAKLYVVNTSNAVVDLSALQIGTQLASDYKEVFSNWHVHERVIEELDLPYSYNKLNQMVSVSNTESQRILHIRVVSPSPDEAKLMADTYARVAQEFIADTMDMQRPNIFQEALRPSAPSSPNKTRNILLGFLLGFVLSAGVVVVQYLVDDRIRSEEEITRYLDLPVLGIMPAEEDNSKDKTGRSKASGKSSGKGGARK